MTDLSTIINAYEKAVLIERKRQVEQIMEITYDLVRIIDRQDVFSEKLLWAGYRKKIRRVLNGSYGRQTKENKMSVNESESTSSMNLYSEEDMQNHCVVAESMQKAVELYMQKYGYEPKTLTLISEYVIVQGVGGASA